MKFSIRDLLLVTVIVAVLGAWWTDRQSLWKENERLRTQLGVKELEHSAQIEVMERYLKNVRADYEQRMP